MARKPSAGSPIQVRPNSDAAMKRALPLFLVCAAATTSLPAQTQTPPRAAGAVQAETTAVLVDVVVRDKRGHPVTDLTAGDFELLEDGVLQDIGAITLYTPHGAGQLAAPDADAPAARPETAASSTASLPREAESPAEPVVALVFDRLTQEGRALAHKAALGYVGREGRSAAIVGVFGIDLSLTTYQSYTRDTMRLRKAIDDAGSRSTAEFEAQAGRARDAGERPPAGASAGSPFAAGGQAAAQAAQSGAGAAAADALAAEMQRRTRETFEALERDQQGHSTSNALLAVVNGMRALPGRKSVVLFSEGVAIPTNVLARFRSVIDTANRANVSIYAMDAAGLRTQSTSAEARDTLNAAVNQMLERNPTADVMGSARTAELERATDAMREDAHGGLAQLTDQTGGMLIRNTNDLTGGFRRIDEDMRNYYMLSYVPKNDRFDGKFRTITVRVKRPGVEVAARKGYYAVRAAGPMPVMSFEAPALALLESTPVPNAFPIRAAALKFPERGRPGLTPVLVSVPASALTFRTSEDSTSYRAEFTVVVRFRNATREIVDKMSQNYVLNGPMDRLDAVKLGNVLFYRQPELAPGVYSMEAIVHDALGDRASVRFATVEQPDRAEKELHVSDLVLVASAERVGAASRPADTPFLVGDMLLYPNLGEPLRKSTTPEIAFFFTVYPVEGEGPQGTLQVLQNGTTLATLPLPLADRDSSGRIQQAGRVPTTALAPGTYELRVVVTQGKLRVAQSTVVRMVD